MGLTCSRDGAAASIAALEQLLCEIRLQLFLPDETRSGRHVKSAIGSGNFPIVIKDEGDGDANVEAAPTSNSVNLSAGNHAIAIEAEDPLSSSSESTSGSEMEETTYEPQLDVGKFHPPFAPDGFCMWQH